MKSITIEVPDSVEMDSFQLKMTLVSELFQQGKLSSGQAAEVLEISKRTFLELIGKFGVSPFGYDSDELLEDLKHV